MVSRLEELIIFWIGCSMSAQGQMNRFRHDREVTSCGSDPPRRHRGSTRATYRLLVPLWYLYGHRGGTCIRYDGWDLRLYAYQCEVSKEFEWLPGHSRFIPISIRRGTPEVLITHPKSLHPKQEKWASMRRNLMCDGDGSTKPDAL